MANNRYKIKVNSCPCWDITFKNNPEKDLQKEAEFQKTIIRGIWKEAGEKIKQEALGKYRFDRLKSDMDITYNCRESVHLQYSGSTAENIEQFETDIFAVCYNFFRAVYEEIGRKLKGMQDEGALEEEASTQNIPDFGITLSKECLPLNLQESKMEGKGTYVIIHGAGYDNPITKSHNQGDNFKKNAEAQKNNLLKKGISNSSIVVASAFTEQEFLNVVNKEYDSGQIVQLDVYSHMSNNAINFGGYETMETANALPPEKDYRLLSYWSNGGINGYNPDGDNEINKINKSNFSNDATMNLWGCNAGWSNAGTPKEYALAQGLADHLKATVNAFDNYSEFKSSGGKLNFDGKMIRSIDRGTQKVVQLTFTPTP